VIKILAMGATQAIAAPRAMQIYKNHKRFCRLPNQINKHAIPHSPPPNAAAENADAISELSLNFSWDARS
jgi:hypothetical protein